MQPEVPMPEAHDLSCVIHVHSTYSDGSATVGEIIDTARRCGRGAVLLTDHDSLGAKRDGWEGWHDGVLLLVGLEISPKGGHCLAFGTEDEIDPKGLSEVEILRAVRAAGALAIAAHPFSPPGRIAGILPRPRPWRALDGVDGIELWSLLADAAGSWRTPLDVYRFQRDPHRALDGPPSANIAAWDRLCRRRPVTAIGSVDAHQTGLRLPGLGAVSPFPNDRYFGLLGTHVLCDGALTGDLGPDSRRVYDALHAGRCYISVDDVADPSGFAFWAERAGAALAMGGEGTGGGWKLRARLPREASIRLIRDGQPIATRAADGLELTAPGAGVYRVEARVRRDGRERPWILSNPIYLR